MMSLHFFARVSVAKVHFFARIIAVYLHLFARDNAILNNFNSRDHLAFNKKTISFLYKTKMKPTLFKIKPHVLHTFPQLLQWTTLIMATKLSVVQCTCMSATSTRQLTLLKVKVATVAIPRIEDVRSTNMR